MIPDFFVRFAFGANIAIWAPTAGRVAASETEVGNSCWSRAKRPALTTIDVSQGRTTVMLSMQAKAQLSSSICWTITHTLLTSTTLEGQPD